MVLLLWNGFGNVEGSKKSEKSKNLGTGRGDVILTEDETGDAAQERACRITFQSSGESQHNCGGDDSHDGHRAKESGAQ